MSSCPSIFLQLFCSISYTKEGHIRPVLYCRPSALQIAPPEGLQCLSIYIFAIILFHLLYERGSYTTGVILQTFRLADRPPGRSATLQTFPPPGRSATLQTFPRKICNIAKFATLQIFPLSLQVFPGEDLQHCRPSPIFVKFRILIFGYIEKRGFKL